MEVVEISVCSNVEENGKVKNTNTTEKIVEGSNESNVCHKTNGVAEVAEPAEPTVPAEDCAPLSDDLEIASDKDANNVVAEVDIEDNQDQTVSQTDNSESVSIETESSAPILSECVSAPSAEDAITVETDSIETTIIDADVQDVESTIELDSVADVAPDRVTFETEVLVETTVNDSNDSKNDDIVKLRQETPDLLNELDQNIEFSEVLRSSDMSGNGVNNNAKPVEEVYNKKELLDILKGNDEKEHKSVLTHIRDEKLSDTELALQQLSRLNKTKRSKANVKVTVRRKSERREVISTKETQVKKESIVKALVSDWDDEEPLEGDQSNELVQDNDNLEKESQNTVAIQEELTKQNQSALRTSVDSVGETSNLNVSKSGDESTMQPQRRLSRIIKKKVIFDPDNPDTFTKVKSFVKNKELPLDKDQIVVKKPKMELEHPRSKSKSPVSKMQWKKPSSKNSKQCKRLSEVDKLLMDEGAVNMIYQLTPEAIKGKKNMRTKAEFIKKLQSTTPDSKEMKFRERKKESKEGEAKKILSGKHRSSISSSVKSSMNDDFEAHSADDSIIYRRHSSSSYSSSCMSPRRLSDVDGGVVQVVTQQSLPQKSECETPPNNETESKNSASESFLEEKNIILKEINKDDCLSIKEKLNTKLSQALNKRKKQMLKTDKPNKQRKTSKSDEKSISREINYSFKYISLKICHKFGEICILDTGTNFNAQVIKEIEKALVCLDSREDTSITLLLSSTGQMCLDLDIDLLLSKSIYDRANDAHEVAESIRSLLCTILNHTKLLCTAVEKECTGLGFTLVALSDVSFASELATFSLGANIDKSEDSILAPGAAVLGYLLPQPLLNNVLLFGRQLTASAALHSGFVTHCFWPTGFMDQIQLVIKDIAAQSVQTVLLKKQLLAVKKTESIDLIKSSLEREREMFVKYYSTLERTRESN